MMALSHWIVVTEKLKSFKLQIHTPEQMTQLALEKKLSAGVFARASTGARRIHASLSSCNRLATWSMLPLSMIPVLPGRGEQVRLS